MEWAGAVMRKGLPNIWAGAVMQKPLINAQKANGDRPSNRRTDQPTNRGLELRACY